MTQLNLSLDLGKRHKQAAPQSEGPRAHDLYMMWVGVNRSRPRRFVSFFFPLACFFFMLYLSFLSSCRRAKTTLLITWWELRLEAGGGSSSGRCGYLGLFHILRYTLIRKAKTLTGKFKTAATSTYRDAAFNTSIYLICFVFNSKIHSQHHIFHI